MSRREQIRSRLQEAIRESGLSQGAVARRAGINPGYLSKLLKGKHVPSAEMLLRLAAALEIPPSGLLGEVEESLSLKKLPVHEEVVVGHPLQTDQKPVGECEVSSAQYRPTRYLLRARGNAMLPTVCEGDLLLVDNGLKPADKDIVTALLNGQRLVRRYYCKDGCVFLAADNSCCPEYITPVRRSDRFRVLGVALETVHRKLRKATSARARVSLRAEA